MNTNKKIIIKLARENPQIFAYYVFRQNNGDRLLPSDYHKEWQEFFTKNKRGVILAPPGIGKSVTITQVRLLWELSKNPNKCFAIISRSEVLAKRSLNVIKQTIEDNPRYKEVFPDIQIDPKNWNQTQLTLLNRNSGIADPSIIALGIGSSTMGRRLDGIVIDDPQDITNCSSKMSEELYEWLITTPLSRLSNDGFCYVISNSWNSKDIAHKLIENGWPSWTTKMLIDDGLETARSIWPERIPLEKINNIRLENGERIFQRLYQNNVTLDNQSYFENSWFDQAKISEFQKVPGQYFIGVDLASRTNDSADSTSFSIIHYDPSTKKRTLIDTISGKWEFPEIIKRIKQLNQTYPVPQWYVENVAAQEYVVQELKKEVLNIKVEGHPTSGKNKLEYVVERLAVEMQQGLWKIVNNNNNNATIIDLKSWQNGDHVPDRVASWLIGLDHIQKYVPYIPPSFTKK
jgi:phage terminase large subunit-like protein